jgi:hypothetical protein
MRKRYYFRGKKKAEHIATRPLGFEFAKGPRSPSIGFSFDIFCKLKES